MADSQRDIFHIHGRHDSPPGHIPAGESGLAGQVPDQPEL